MDGKDQIDYYYPESKIFGAFLLSILLKHMNIDAYLNRINYTGRRDVSIETLQALQLAHLYAVPFENLSIHNDQPIILDESLLFEKVVGRRRGGFCYELNGLFSSLLRGLGFEVERLAAGVGRDNGQFSHHFDHMTLLVTLETRWLVDVGFGDTFRQPLRLDERGIQSQPSGDYRLECDGDERYTMWERRPNKDWRHQLRFGLQPYDYPDFVPRCHYQQTDPGSTFVARGAMSTLATPTGRQTLSKNKLISTTLAGERTERDLADAAEIDHVLKTIFGIVI